MACFLVHTVLNYATIVIVSVLFVFLSAHPIFEISLNWVFLRHKRATHAPRIHALIQQMPESALKLRRTFHAAAIARLTPFKVAQHTHACLLFIQVGK